MRFLSSLVLASVVTVPVAACGGDEESVPVPTGPHYTYVVSELLVPKNSNEVRDYGIDLDNDERRTPDNQLGSVFATLAGQGLKIQDEITSALNAGEIIALVDLQTPDFASSSGTGLNVMLGATPNPAPCTDPEDPTTCGKHLDGNGSFTIEAGTTSDVLAGRVAGGVFTGGPGNVTLEISLSDAPIRLNLIGARAKALGMSESGIEEMLLGGAITQTDLDNELIPTIHTALVPRIIQDCPGNMPPECDCMPNTTGKTVLSLFDTTPKDCMVSVEEIRTNNLIVGLLSADVVIDGVDALAIGVKMKAVKAAIQ